nr:hypothetical protein GCM10020093_044470 [Planobispora longispora]
MIEQALLHRRVLRIAYTDSKGQATEREVEPGVFVGGRGGHWYLVGWCRSRGDVRIFRLDRISRAEETDEPSPSTRRSGSPRGAGPGVRKSETRMKTPT